MAIDIYEGKCRDCFNKRDGLRPMEDSRLMNPPVEYMNLCLDCYTAREKDFAEGNVIRPIGIPPSIPNTIWLKLPTITLKPNHGRKGDNLVVEAVFREPQGEVLDPALNGCAEIRMKIGESKHWVPGGILDLGTPAVRRNLEGYASSSVRTFLRNEFAPDMVFAED